MVTAEAATVYRGGGRRWFTLAAACRAQAKTKIKDNCMCDYIDHEGYGRQHLPCNYHDGSDHAEKVLRRLTRIYVKAYKEQNHD